MPPYWVREENHTLYIFFANPRSRGLAFPISYGQSFSVETKTVDVVITDFNLPGKDGQYLLEQVKTINPTIPVVLITAYASVDGAVTAMQSG